MKTKTRDEYEIKIKGTLVLTKICEAMFET